MADDSDTLAPSDTDNQIVPKPRVDQSSFVGLQKWYQLARDHSQPWRADARVWYDMKAGEQWSPEDMAQLKDQLRPVITFNRIDPVINTVSGLEIGNRQETAYIPRQVGSQGPNDLLTAAAKFYRGECDAEDEESESFIDLLTCGMGWTETRLDYDVDPDGAMDIPRIDPMEMYWDPSAKKKNLGDRKFHCRVKDTPIEEARSMFPGFTDEELDARWADDTGAATDPHNAQQAPFYRNDQSDKIDRDRDTVRLVEFEWWEHEVSWRLQDPMTGQLISLPNDQFHTLVKRLEMMGHPEPTAVKMRKRIYWRAFLGAEILKKWKGPDKGFAYNVMTGSRDRNKNLWYGLLKGLCDPQRWANKWLSQGLHILNTGAKGGIIAEVDAFDDWDEALEDWAAPDAIVKAAVGAISKEKIKDRPVAQIPQGYENMMTFAVSSMRDCSGVNMELLGSVNEDQPGIVEHMRKQAGMTVLAGFFNSLRRYRKTQGKLMLYFITNFLSDGRLIRIGGAENAQYVPLIHDPNTVEYDVIVDETPTSPNMKDQIWGTLTTLFPVLQKMDIPAEGWTALMKYSPLPASVVNEFEQALQQAQQKAAANPPPPDPKMITAQSNAELNKAKGFLAMAQAKDVASQNQIDTMRAQSENLKSVAEAHGTLSDSENTRADTEMKRSSAILNLAKAEAERQNIPLDHIMAVVHLLDTARQIHEGRTNALLQHRQQNIDLHEGEQDRQVQREKPAAQAA